MQDFYKTIMLIIRVTDLIIITTKMKYDMYGYEEK